MKATLTTTMLVSAILQLGIQGYNLLSDTVPVEYKPIVAGAVAFAQILVNHIAHTHNTDGTSESVPGPKD